MATYSFLQVAATIIGPGGIITLGNGAGDSKEGIEIERENDQDTMVIGADGTPMHSLIAGTPGTVTVNLLKTSSTNALLNLMFEFQRISAANWGQNNLTITDLSSGDVINCTSVAFRRYTPLTYAEEANINRWNFNAGQIIGFLGTYS